MLVEGHFLPPPAPSRINETKRMANSADLATYAAHCRVVAAETLLGNRAPWSLPPPIRAQRFGGDRTQMHCGPLTATGTSHRSGTAPRTSASPGLPYHNNCLRSDSLRTLSLCREIGGWRSRVDGGVARQPRTAGVSLEQRLSQPWWVIWLCQVPRKSDSL
jgi:hypothetical protein